MSESLKRPLKNPNIRDVVNIMSDRGFYRDAVKVTDKNGNPILEDDPLNLAREKYYGDVPNMSLKTLRRERNPDIIPKMTTQQLRTLSDELYKNMSNFVLNYRRFLFLEDNPDFLEEIRSPYDGPDYNTNLGAVFMYQWRRAGTETNYTPTEIFDIVLPRHMGEHYNEQWRENNERKYFENVYRALILPPYDGGRKRTRRTPRRKSRKSRKNKRKTKRRRS